MTRTLIYQSEHKWRFGAALAAAAMIHLAAISFAAVHRVESKTAAGFSTAPPEIIVEPPEPSVDPQVDQSEPLPTPPVIDETYVETLATPPPVHRQSGKSPRLVQPRSNIAPGPLNLSSAKVFAISAPRPEYPYEARRQRITGDGIAFMTIDPGTGNVIEVMMSRSTGNSFLDNAALTGFRRWRFKPGTVSSVTCPVTFTLTGASY